MVQRPEDDRASHRLDTQMLSDLWVFRAAATASSITAAAEMLNVTQSAVSQRVLRLESRLGTALLVRDKNGIATTDVGAALANAMNQVSSLLGDVLADIKRPAQRSIVVSCAPSLATEWLVPKLEDFYARHPGVEVFVRSEMLPASDKRLLAEGIDLVITYQPTAPPELHELAAIGELVFPVCSRRFRDTLASDGDDAAPVLLHDDMPWGASCATPTEWDAWRKASGSAWPPQRGGSRHFNLAQLAYHAAVVNQGVALGHAVTANRLLGKGELVAALDVPAVAGAVYRISSAQADAARPALRVFALWWRAAMEETQQTTLALLGIARA